LPCRAEAFEGAVDAIVDVRGLANVGGHDQARAANSLDLVADRFERRAAAATDRDAGAGAGEIHGGGPSNAGASSRDQGKGARVRVCAQRGAKGLRVHWIASMRPYRRLPSLGCEDTVNEILEMLDTVLARDYQPPLCVETGAQTALNGLT
jgi:hypothetical protein